MSAVAKVPLDRRSRQINHYIFLYYMAAGDCRVKHVLNMCIYSINLAITEDGTSDSICSPLVKYDY